MPPVRTSPDDRVIRRPSIAAGHIECADRGLAQRLVDRYGDAAAEMAEAARPGELDPIEGSTACLAELRWSSSCEAVVHLDDLMLRRSRLGLLLPHGGDAVLGSVKPVVLEVLGWDEAAWRSELQRYRDIVARHYALPPAVTPPPEA